MKMKSFLLPIMASTGMIAPLPVQAENDVVGVGDVLIVEEAALTIAAPEFVVDLAVGTELEVVGHRKAIKACIEDFAYRTTGGKHRYRACAYDFDRDGRFEKINAAGGAARRVEPFKYRLKVTAAGSD